MPRGGSWHSGSPRASSRLAEDGGFSIPFPRTAEIGDDGGRLALFVRPGVCWVLAAMRSSTFLARPSARRSRWATCESRHVCSS